MGRKKEDEKQLKLSRLEDAKVQSVAEADAAQAAEASAGVIKGEDAEPNFETANKTKNEKRAKAETPEFPTVNDAKKTKAGSPANRRKKYFKVKTYVMGREAENETKLCFVYSGQGWYKLFGHSAVIFHYYVAPKAGINSNLRDDNDYECKSEEGVVSISDMNFVHKKLIKIGMQLLDYGTDTVVYNVGKRFTEADLKAMMDEKQLDRARMNSIVRPKNIMPEFFALLRGYAPQIMFKTRRIEGVARETLAMPIVERAAEVSTQYSLICNDEEADMEEFQRWVNREMSWIMARIEVLHEARLIDDAASFQLLYSGQKIKRALDKCMRREE